jgi:hypothetical protein
MPLDFDVVIEADPAFLPFGVEAGSVLRAGRSSSSNNARRLVPKSRVTRALSCATSSRMAVLISGSEKKRRLRSLAMIQRVVTCTATSTLTLSRGFLGRAGTTAVP